MPPRRGQFTRVHARLSSIATLDGNHSWLLFHFGLAIGLMRVPRPWEREDIDNETRVLWRGETGHFDGATSTPESRGR